jgi:hypothetical protein
MRLTTKHLMRTRRLEKLISIQDWTNLDKKKIMKCAKAGLKLPWPRGFLGLANANCEKTREEKGKTSGEFVSDSWFG